MEKDHHQLAQPGNTCDYCGNQLAAQYYFCLRCGTPYKDPESVIAPVATLVPDTETLVRTRAPQAITVYFCFLGALLITAVLSAGIFPDEDDFEKADLFGTIVLAVLTVVFAGIYWDALKVQLKRIGFDHGAAYIGLAILVPTLFFNYFYHAFWMQSGLFETFDDDDMGRLYSTRMAAIIFVCVMPAIVEEISFRGLIQHWLHAAIDPWKAILLASVLFSAAHFSFISAPYLFGVGVLLGWVRWKTGSLYPSMLLHFLHNYAVITWF